MDDHLVIKKVRYSSPTPITSPTSASLFESTSCLPTKKRLPFIQYSDNDQCSKIFFQIQLSFCNGILFEKRVKLIALFLVIYCIIAITRFEMESVKKLVLSRMGTESGAEGVITLLDKMSHRISTLEQICKTQEKTIRDITETKVWSTSTSCTSYY